MLLNARQPRNTTKEVTGAEKALRRRKTLSAQPQSSISKDRCGSEELGENTDRFGTTHKDFPPTQSKRRPEFVSQVGFFDKKSIRDDLRTDSRYIMYLYVYIKLYFWKYISYCEMKTRTDLEPLIRTSLPPNQK